MNRKPGPRLNDLRLIADLMDRHFKGPFGIRFGWDGLLGMIPIVGDVVTGAVSLYVILRAATIGCPASVILRMGINLLVENAIDVIPLFGNLFDFFWKANSKNLVLIERYLENPAKVKRGSRFFVAFAVLVVMLLVISCIAAGVFLIAYLLKEIPWK